MRRAGLILLGFATIAAAPAERPTGSNVPGGQTSSPIQQTGNVDPNWKDAEAVSEREARRMTRRFAQCVVKHHPNPSMIVVSTDISNLEITKKYPMLQDTDCALQADRSNASFRLSLNGNGLRYALAEALVNAQFPEPWAAISSAPPILRRVHDDARFTPRPGRKLTPAQLQTVEEARVLDEGLVLAEQLGECIARADPTNVHRLLFTQPVSLEEDAAVNALYPHLPACVPTGKKVTVNVSIVRGAAALSYYRLAKALPNNNPAMVHP